ncbi:hypothetical protein TIFTF001_006285 [Ficus carica]|uniref:DNA N(6)-methyladenine demethylase n=1 Tax=Ficus carica TaxID=3494 RepID=A0AA88D0L2_FICCA|nr:hypothetical protein TIFTF001_006285 [Ficus carica]
MDRGRGRGRGRGNPRSNPSRSGGRQFMGSGVQFHPRFDPQPGGSSRGRREKFIYVPKHQVGPNSPDAVSGVSEEVHPVIASDLPHNGIENSSPLSSPQGSSLHTEEEKTHIGQISVEVKCDNVKLTDDSPNKLDISCQQVENRLPLKHSDEDETGFKTPAGGRMSGNSESSAASVHFDICPPKTGGVKLKPPLLVKNREIRNKTKRTIEDLDRSLRPGMVILKRYISSSDQIKIVKQCRELGLGPGGFYEPGYREGAKLHLKMMCLGKNWDPQTSKYDDFRPADGAKPPAIPKEFYNLVEKAIQDSHSLISKELEAGNAEKILPRMRPDICIVNFYSTNGRLGLHQDRDESRDSIDKGLPVISFSIGDTAKFLYGDQRDADQAKDVLLESGDVLIFGGNSRNVFHGVTAILTDTAPKSLLEETNLRPGRLNLTFRQY